MNPIFDAISNFKNSYVKLFDKHMPSFKVSSADHFVWAGRVLTILNVLYLINILKRLKYDQYM